MFDVIGLSFFRKDEGECVSWIGKMGGKASLLTHGTRIGSGKDMEKGREHLESLRCGSSTTPGTSSMARCTALAAGPGSPALGPRPAACFP